MKVYIVESHDDWNDSHYICDVFVSKEAAIVDLLECNEDLVYDERYGRYEHSKLDSTRYYTIEEHTVRN